MFAVCIFASVFTCAQIVSAVMSDNEPSLSGFEPPSKTFCFEVLNPDTGTYSTECGPYPTNIGRSEGFPVMYERMVDYRQVPSDRPMQLLNSLASRLTQVTANKAQPIDLTPADPYSSVLDPYPYPSDVIYERAADSRKAAPKSLDLPFLGFLGGGHHGVSYGHYQEPYGHGGYGYHGEHHGSFGHGGHYPQHYPNHHGGYNSNYYYRTAELDDEPVSGRNVAYYNGYPASSFSQYPCNQCRNTHSQLQPRIVNDNSVNDGFKKVTYNVKIPVEDDVLDPKLRLYPIYNIRCTLEPTDPTPEDIPSYDPQEPTSRAGSQLCKRNSEGKKRVSSAEFWDRLNAINKKLKEIKA